MQKISSHRGCIYSLDISPNTSSSLRGPVIVSGSADKTIKIWKLQEKESSVFEIFQTIYSDYGYPFCVTISSSNSMIVVGFEDKSLSIYSIQDRKKKYKLFQHEESLSSSFLWKIQLAKNAQGFMLSSGDGDILLYKKTADYFTLQQSMSNSGLIFAAS